MANKILTNYQKNLKILPWVAACTSFEALFPFFVIYEKSCGLSYLKIFITQVVFALSVILFDIPLGVMADIYGRRRLLIIGQVFFCFALSLFFLWPFFSGFLLGEFFLALSFAARTGVDTSLLFETTKHLGIEESYCEEEGKYQSYARYSEGVSAVLGGFAAMVSLSMPAFLTWLVSFPSIFLGYFLHEEKTTTDTKLSEKISSKLRTQIQLIKEFLLNSKHNFLWIFLYSGTLSAVIINIFWLMQVFLKTYQVNLVLIGALSFIYQMTSGFIASKSSQFVKHHQLIFWLLPALLQIMAMVLGITHSAWFFPFFFLASITLGIKITFIYNLLHPKVEDNIRAGLMSIDSLSTRIIFILIALPLGWILDNISLNMGFWLLSIPNLFAIWLVLSGKLKFFK